ncbi:MAG: ATP phosphoribosyltransferase [Ignavibacteria bacterium RIFOXYB2_FULL_35_12]|nr:MAG: ATP phosphoribosyltransferase [Ignavibacteria bacterium GWA2_36_19]OGU52999.1 MAG: ATP phosphoribosyltransferase [Ignavibacteria bacterium GWC2_35_8]OGU56024.1 MAG: ATP phosphoribosyltransferase [Ignavibacteria bacterium GWF2_35_20]OGU83998.1 MAG: ATP phosphoribosyltransferase [Ignavibacteria bacterium RIFOXYA12_FULL_35_25]OGU91965.1 MAG: ATP phosphoribosyltransferase [Ignavibacteria bacterium RIFOXYC12_FULL_35_11]OGU95216.1 MAG: ATP phosphoribosyltransferase [Ignavibacteria bacterium 
MQNGNGNIKLAVQKDGRLTENSLQLLRNCNLDIEKFSDKLVVSVRNFKLDLLFLRDDDIPEYVQDGVAELGIVGEDVIKETKSDVKIVKKLGFGKCNLRIAIPENIELKNLSSLNHKRIATSFPNILTDYLLQNKIDAKVVHISGSVEAAPSLGIADYICDLVSTGNTLKLNKLKASINVLESEAVLIKNKGLQQNSSKFNIYLNLLSRIESVLNAKNSKYLMMNVDKDSLMEVLKLIPSLKSPTVLPLANENMLAVHAVIPAEKFWEIVDDLKSAGASGILLLPIENIVL